MFQGIIRMQRHVTFYGEKKRRGEGKGERVIRGADGMNRIILMMIMVLTFQVGLSLEDDLIYTNYHLVKRGDTLEKIAGRYGVGIESIRGINNLEEDVIYEGQRLYLDLGEYKERWVKLDLTGGRKISGGRRIIKGRSDPVVSVEYRSTKPDFLWPLEWKGATSEWGYRRDPITGKEEIKHSGVDLRAGIGTPVYAPSEGIVRSAGWMKGYGRIVIIDHDNGYSTRFAHLDEYLVGRGDKVSRGELIAKSGNSGRSTGPHLHYEIRRDETAIDPMTFR